jgi:hypothetical protein
MNIGGNGYVSLWLFLVGYFMLCILFPDCTLLKFLSKIVDKLMNGGGRERW